MPSKRMLCRYLVESEKGALLADRPAWAWLSSSNTKYRYNSHDLGTVRRVDRSLARTRLIRCLLKQALCDAPIGPYVVTDLNILWRVWEKNKVTSSSRVPVPGFLGKRCLSHLMCARRRDCSRADPAAASPRQSRDKAPQGAAAQASMVDCALSPWKARPFVRASRV